MQDFHAKTAERLMRYARIDTQSDRFSQTVPTTAKQFDLAHELERELNSIGASDVYLDSSTCVLYAFLPSTLPGQTGLPFGLVTHMDTAPDACGSHVNPRLIHYEGGDIELSPGICMRETEFPSLRQYTGQDLVVTDGTTLLGGDDKAGTASVITFAEYLLRHPEIGHPKIALAFTPDEEVSGLARDLDLKRFGVPVAYTLDGDHLGYWENETFNASEAFLDIDGVSVHPGTAKGIMINACDVAAEFLHALPAREKPQYTEDREGFFHVVGFQGTCEHASVHLIIRDHDAELFARREALVRSLASDLQKTYGEQRIHLNIVQNYRSMKEIIDRVPFMIDDLKAAISACGIEPRSIAFRGGTDGSALSHRGLPCPNLSAGYENAHGRFEYVPVPSMAANVCILLELASRFALRSEKDLCEPDC